MLTKIGIGVGAVAALGLVVWLYGRTRGRLGRSRQRNEQREAASDARDRIQDVPADSERSVTERLREGSF